MAYNQLGEAKLEDYGFWERARIFFVQTRFRQKKGSKVYYYKIYRNRKVLVRTEVYDEL